MPYKDKEKARKFAADWIRRHRAAGLSDSEKEAVRRYARNSYWRHRESRKAQVRAYRQANKSICNIRDREKTAKRRLAIAASSDGTATLFYKRIYSMTTVSCYYCGKVIPAESCHIDHVIALSKNGNHASENLCASCPDCNLSKGSKLPSEMMFVNQIILNL